MSMELVMPRAGLTMVEGTISCWLVQEGAAVQKGDIIMEYENEKNTIEFASTESGFLHITAKEGDTVAVGGPIAVVAATKEEYDGLTAGAAPKAEAVSVAEVAVQPTAAAQVPAVRPAALTAEDGRIRATGYAKKLAREKQVELKKVKGTGPNGRVLAQDVLDYLAEDTPAAAPAAAAAFVPTGEAAVDVITKIPMTGIRKDIANNMYHSLQSMAQCTAAAEIDVTDLLAYRQKLVAQQDFLGCKVTVNDLLSMAVVKMLKKHPLVNATFDGKTIFAHSSVNLSVAVAAEAGLMVPVVKSADRMSLVQLHNAMKDLAQRARDKQLRDGEQANGTFTISNVGMFPIDWSTPIINPPQVAILGFGRAVKKMAVVNDQPAVRSMMTMYLTFDHRVIDGLEVGRVMEDMQTLLCNPELITA